MVQYTLLPIHAIYTQGCAPSYASVLQPVRPGRVRSNSAIGISPPATVVAPNEIRQG